MIEKYFSRKSKDMNGVVLSLSTNKTVKVARYYNYRLPKYNKNVTRRSTFLVHDEKSICKPGNAVLFYVTRPISKRKYTVIKSVVRQ